VNGQSNRKANRRRTPSPLNERGLKELALAYVGRFATSRGRLRAYLARKIRERGWDGTEEPDLAGLADRFAAQGYVDDAGYALAQARTLSARGYGKRRLERKLRAAGIDEEDSAAARGHSDREALSAALRFAERRRIGPFATAPADIREREKALAAMIRAGHGFGLARLIASLPPGAPVDLDDLTDRASQTLI
jgi:regulatory protein